jgi:hypothetical protein
MMADALRPPWQVLIIGAQAAGKMTVGRELSRLTGAALLHNHLIIDLLTEFFPFGTPPYSRLAEELRHRIAEEAAGFGTNLIMTGGWAFDDPSVLPMVERWLGAVTDRGGAFAFVELRAPLELRLERNRSELRRTVKKVDWATDEALTEMSRTHRWESNGDFPFPERHLVIDSATTEPEAAAWRIIERFGLEPAGEL